MKKIVFTAGLFAVSLSMARADVIAAWTFEHHALAVNNNPAPSTGSGTASSIGMDQFATPNIGVTADDVVLGATGDTGTNGVANLSQIWRVRAQAGTAGAANGWSSQAPIGSRGVMFAASTAGYTSIKVSFDWYTILLPSGHCGVLVVLGKEGRDGPVGSGFRGILGRNSDVHLGFGALPRSS